MSFIKSLDKSKVIYSPFSGVLFPFVLYIFAPPFSATHPPAPAQDFSHRCNGFL